MPFLEHPAGHDAFNVYAAMWVETLPELAGDSVLPLVFI